MPHIDVLTIAWKEGKGLPFSPFCHFCLAERSSQPYGDYLIGPQMMTDQEIDECADLLIREIESARKKAKRELAKHKRKTV